MGKSYLTGLIAKVLSSSGILLTNTVLTKTRADFIGQYLGETALKTSALLASAYQGVLFVDEAYELARFNKDANDHDPYGSEAIVEMISFLSENKGCIAVFVAGYKGPMLDQFMKINDGIPRRFPTVLELDGYTGKGGRHLENVRGAVVPGNDRLGGYTRIHGACTTGSSRPSFPTMPATS